VIDSAENALSVAIFRVMSIMQRKGLFAPMPASLRGVPLKIDYVSIMKQMQKAAETTAMTATVKFAGDMQEAAQAAGLPSPIRILDLEAFVRRFSDIVGSPAKLVKGVQQVKQEDAARAKAQQQQQALQATLPAVQAAQGLSKTEINPGQSALQAILGTGASGTAGRA
jgi:Bacteriophage head to tail connecting protein